MESYALLIAATLNAGTVLALVLAPSPRGSVMITWRFELSVARQVAVAVMVSPGACLRKVSAAITPAGPAPKMRWWVMVQAPETNSGP